ncbi:unnamed protein product [Owenia fusiformis]|uniref:CCHC-type domain-containing protein n=1 Tax=Owenia fusiformis TaxID=6347 RepID=A0A8S4NIH1_OWEFU|nr:unnamed protein product [Owenia fusiformis]
MVSRVGKWSPQVKSEQLFSLLRGPALAVVTDMPELDQDDFDKVMLALQERFDPPHQQDQYRDLLTCRIRNPGESVTDLAADIRRMVKLGYPKADLAAREDRAVDVFRDALNDEAHEWAVRQSNPQTLQEALAAALKYESHKQKRLRKRGVVSQVMAVNVSEVPVTVAKSPDLSSILERIEKLETNSDRQKLFKNPCWNCDEVGHNAKTCPRPKNAAKINQKFKEYNDRSKNLKKLSH